MRNVVRMPVSLDETAAGDAFLLLWTVRRPLSLRGRVGANKAGSHAVDVYPFRPQLQRQLFGETDLGVLCSRVPLDVRERWAEAGSRRDVYDFALACLFHSRSDRGARVEHTNDIDVKQTLKF